MCTGRRSFTHLCTALQDNSQRQAVAAGHTYNCTAHRIPSNNTRATGSSQQSRLTSSMAHTKPFQFKTHPINGHPPPTHTLLPLVQIVERVDKQQTTLAHTWCANLRSHCGTTEKQKRSTKQQKPWLHGQPAPAPNEMYTAACMHVTLQCQSAQITTDKHRPNHIAQPQHRYGLRSMKQLAVRPLLRHVGGAV